MSDSRVKGFFYSGNAVHGEPYYWLAENFVRTAEAFANTTCWCYARNGAL